MIIKIGHNGKVVSVRVSSSNTPQSRRMLLRYVLEHSGITSPVAIHVTNITIPTETAERKVA
jgi:hypothetical protein